MIRWVCPDCGVGALGPKRPRNDATVRFCLSCSARTGRLVPRTAPALERQRETRADQQLRREQREQRVVRERERTYGFKGLDLLVYLRRFWELPSIREARVLSRSDGGRETPRRTLPELVIRRSPAKSWTSGHEVGVRHTRRVNLRRIVLTVGLADDHAGVLVTLLHEVVHAALPCNVHHGPQFWAYLITAAEAWGVSLALPAVLGSRNYDRHQAIEAAVRPHGLPEERL
jgi:hypothetical protein